MLKVWDGTIRPTCKRRCGASANSVWSTNAWTWGGPFGGLDTLQYMTMNPNSRIPTIEDDGNILWESHSVIRYLALKYGKGTLCPDDLGERQKADRWMDWPHNGFNHHIRTLFFALVRDREKVEPDMDAMNAVVAEAEDDLPILDGYLSNNEYVAGATFTMGDIPLGCIVHRWYSYPSTAPAIPRLKHGCSASGNARLFANTFCSKPVETIGSRLRGSAACHCGNTPQRCVQMELQLAVRLT